MTDEILVKQDGPILRITLNAPDRGNAVTDDNVRELTRLINGAGEKADMVVLRGAGKEFCVGRAGMGSRPATEPTAYARRGFSDVVFDAYGAMRNCPIPIIAVVQGGAHGFGCAIAAACDITIASDKAMFSVPEMAHQIMPTMVMSSFVDRVPRKAMAYLVYSTFEVSPERALSYGIISDVVPAAQLDSHVDKLTAAVRDVFDLRPAAIIRDLDLRRPIYKKTAAYGHFGRQEKEFTWEATSRVDDLKSALGI